VLKTRTERVVQAQESGGGGGDSGGEDLPCLLLHCSFVERPTGLSYPFAFIHGFLSLIGSIRLVNWPRRRASCEDARPRGHLIAKEEALTSTTREEALGVAAELSWRSSLLRIRHLKGRKHNIQQNSIVRNSIFNARFELCLLLMLLIHVLTVLCGSGFFLKWNTL
jgi:hypothetical protein